MATNPASPPFFSFRSLSTLHSSIAHVVYSAPISHSPSTQIANRPHRQQHPQIHSHTPPHHPFLTASLLTQANLRCDPLARSPPNNTRPPAPDTGRLPLARTKCSMQALSANAARRTPHAMPMPTPRHAAAVPSPGTLSKRGAHGKVDATQRSAAHCIFLHGSTVV
ncbi:hypothetical protein CcaCcLH18_10108 [Colletotrichum camelliae]|nr:hypothetical protein CcaCcLH18_10108 [Colletotrichum camelliae]